jgi:uncharacterized SAM-dependent methyltransferase
MNFHWAGFENNKNYIEGSLKGAKRHFKVKLDYLTISFDFASQIRIEVKSIPNQKLI